MKIKFFSNYCDSNQLTNRIVNNYYLNFKLDYEITNDNNYDVAIIFNNYYKDINKKSILIMQEPSWSNVYQNNYFINKSDFIIIHDNKYVNRKVNVIEMPSLMFYHDHINNSFFNNQFNKEKKISYIVSALQNSFLHKKRIELLNVILNSDLNIDIYGRNLNINDIRYKGSLLKNMMD